MAKIVFPDSNIELHASAELKISPYKMNIFQPH